MNTARGNQGDCRWPDWLRWATFQKLLESQEAEGGCSFQLGGRGGWASSWATYVLWDLDVGEGVLGGLCWQGPDAEGGGDDGQAGGGHHFSLRTGEKRRKRQN